MANPKIKFKRSSVEGKRPDINSMELGELAINTHDGRVYVRRDTNGEAGIDTGNKLVNPWIENNSNTGVACSHDLGITGVATFYGDVSVIGTLTHEEVTNIDSIGIVTARSGVTVSSGDIKILNGNLSVSGVATATAFVGDGSGLTNVGGADTTNVRTDSLIVIGVATATTFVGDVTGTASNASSLNNQNASYYLNYNNFSNTPTIPTNNNELTNGAGYITTSFTSYNQLSDTPTIPTNNDELTNGAGYITTSFTDTSQLTNGAGFIISSDNITGTSRGLSNDPDISVTDIDGRNINITGVITATSFVGDGSNLTNVTGSGIGPTDSVNTTGIITAGSFVKSGGGSDEFLKADGSVDTNSYATETAVGLATAGLASVVYVDQEISNISTGDTTNVRTDSLVVSGVSTLSTVLGTGGTFSTDLYFTKNRNNTVGDGSIHLEPGNSSTAWSLRIDTADNLNFDVNTGSYSELIWFEPDGGAQFSGKVGVATCTEAGEATNKGYVDTQVGLATANIISNTFPGRRYTYNSGISSEGDINDLTDGQFWIDTSSSNFTIWVAAKDADNINQFGTITTTFSHTYNPKQLFTIRDYYNSSPVRHGQWEKISVSSQPSGRKIKFECGSSSTNVFHSQGGSISNGDDYCINIVGWL